MQTAAESIAVIVFSEDGKAPHNCLESASRVGKVYLLHPPRCAPPDFPGVENIPVDESVPAVCNRILERCGCEFLAVIEDEVELNPSLPKILRNIPPNAEFIYGDYIEICDGMPVPKKSYTGPEDITERAELGPVAIYRTAGVKRIGGWNQTLKYAHDYDLRLKLGERGALHHIPEAQCTISPSPGIEERGAEKLFFPGRGKYGGFSYLFMDPEEEKEIEGVFRRSLKRRNAYLEGDAPPMRPEPLGSPAVSVLTPVYNREKFIGPAIESVLGGKFRDFEYIIIDNGSTDDTAKVVESCAKDPRVRLIRNPVNRIALSLNIGLNAARGKYIAQLDSDDLYTPDTLESMVEFMEGTNCGLGISYYSLIDENGNDLPEFGIIKHLEYSRNNILRVDGAGAVRLWRKSAMMEFGGFDQEELCDYGEDYDLVLKVGERYKVGRVHQVLYKYRRHPDNSDIKRDPLFKLRNKNLARERALKRRVIMNIGVIPQNKRREES